MKQRFGTLCLALILLLCGGCAPSREEQEYSRYLLAMDTIMTLTAYGTKAAEGLAAAEEVILELEDLLSVTDENSELWAINHSGGGPVAVREDTAALLDLSRTLWERTGGALDPTIYPVVQAWGFTAEEKRVPGEPELVRLLEHVGLDAVGWDGASVTLPDGMALDFGSIAKGYAGKQAAAALTAAGVTSALLNLGGNIQTVGAKPDGSPWRIGVTNPADPEGPDLGVVTVGSGEALVTSAGYQRYFEADGQLYWHILDPATGTPARSGLSSVTVIGADGAVCDGLSTALFILGADKAADYWRTWGGFDLVMVTERGAVLITEGLEDRFTLREKDTAPPLTVLRNENV